MRVTAKLFLLEIDDVDSTILSSDPKQAGTVTVDLNHGVITQARGIRFIVSK